MCMPPFLIPERVILINKGLKGAVLCGIIKNRLKCYGKARYN